MSLKRLALICTLPLFVAGCSVFQSTQAPAPVYSGQQKPSAAITQKKIKKPNTTTNDIVKTEPLKDYSNIKTEPLQPSSTIPLSEPTTIETPDPSLPEPPSSPAPAELTPFEPIGATVRLSPAVGALVSAANQKTLAGDLETASASLERAIRIEPRNATLFYKLALLRLKQSNPNLAEDLAKKSALLASTDNTLKKHCWLLIAHVRELQQDFTGAKEARDKADSF